MRKNIVVIPLAQAITGRLGFVTATDGRGGTAGWTGTAGGMDFTGPRTIASLRPA